MKVKEIMSRDVKLISPATPIQEAAKLMRDKDIGSIPVGENDRLVGIVTDRDIAIRAFANGKDIKSTVVKDVMTPKSLYCFEEDTVEGVSQNMAKNQVRRLPVLSSEKRLVGIVSLGDLAIKGSKQGAAEALQAISQKSH